MDDPLTRVPVNSGGVVRELESAELVVVLMALCRQPQISAPKQECQ